ncbi:MAG: DNA-3-methyladenine glycosylase 2 family protein [Hyphomicrobiaceae bacterium]|nr:DNA-3-methyladenine glycosylase 2 family protein [Hyphomicrobiaceae bacterium]
MPAKTRAPVTAIESEDDIRRGVRSLRRKCKVMRRVHDATGDPPLRRRPGGFEGLARIIVGQQVSVASANAIWARCAANIAPFTPATVDRMEDEALRACGLSSPKVRTLRAVAGAILEGSLPIDTLAAAREEDIQAQLCAVKGIGPWTADIYLMFCLGKPDAFAPGDLALQVAAQHAFALDERPGPDALLEMAQAWRPWRGVSARLLWAYHKVIKDRSAQPI